MVKLYSYQLLNMLTGKWFIFWEWKSFLPIFQSDDLDKWPVRGRKYFSFKNRSSFPSNLSGHRIQNYQKTISNLCSHLYTSFTGRSISDLLLIAKN